MFQQEAIFPRRVLSWTLLDPWGKVRSSSGFHLPISLCNPKFKSQEDNKLVN